MACRLTRRHRMRGLDRRQPAGPPRARDVLRRSGDRGGRRVPADLGEAGNGPDRSWRRRSSVLLVTTSSPACIAQQPNMFGGIEPMAELADAAHAVGAQLVAVVEPTSLALLAAARIATGPTSWPPRASRSASRRRTVARTSGSWPPAWNRSARCPAAWSGATARRAGAQGLRPDPPGARAAHPAREGGQQHLHQPGALRAGRDRLPLGGRAGGPARGGRPVGDPGPAELAAAIEAAGLGQRRFSAAVLRRGRDPRPGCGRAATARLAEQGRLAGFPLASLEPDYPSCATRCCWPPPS